MKVSFKLQEMQQVANKIISLLSQYCEKIEVAGSIRREKTFISDIEIIYIPKTDTVENISLFESSKIEINNQLKNYINLDKDFSKRLNKLGRPNFGNDIQLMLYKNKYAIDFFRTNLCGWYLDKLVRTGSKEFNIFIIQELKKYNYTINLHNKCIEQTINNDNIITIYPASEQEIFKLANLSYISPQKRNTLNYTTRDYR